MRFLDVPFIIELNKAIYATKGFLPDLGGINDQQATFVHLWQAFENDKQLIDSERLNKAQQHGR